MSDTTNPPETTPDVLRRHATDVRRKAYWVAAFLTLILMPSPAIITVALGEPAAGMKEVLTIWHVLAYTLPLTVAVAIDGGILLLLQRHPERRPETQNDVVMLGCALAAVLVVSMLIGSWLGMVETSSWARERLDGASGAYTMVDPHGMIGHNLTHLPPPVAERIAIVALVVAAVGGLANYFTLYGPQMFGASLVVGAFLGWLWAVKVIEVMRDLRNPTGAQRLQNA